MKSNFWTSFDFSRNRGTLATRQRSNNLASSPGRKFVLPVVRHYRGQQLKPIIQIPGREGREDREKIRSVPDFRVCPHFHTPPKSHTRLSNNNGHWPSAIPGIFQARWFNPTMDRPGAGQCPGQMHCRRQTAAKRRGWLQNRGGGMEPLALSQATTLLLKAWVVVPFHAASRYLVAFFLSQGMTALSAKNLLRFFVEQPPWSIRNAEGETTNDICRVAE